MVQKLIALLLAVILLLSGTGRELGALFGEPKTAEANGPWLGTDLIYGDDDRNRVDLALPASTDGEVGLILFIYGGAWVSGQKEQYRASLSQFAELGYAAAALNYRYISEDTHMDDLLDDIDAALARVRLTALLRGYRITGALLTGASAGAHLSMLYAYTRRETAPIPPKAVVSYCGPADFTDPDFIERNLLGPDSLMLSYSYWATGVFLPPEDYHAKTGAYEEAMTAARAISPLFCLDAQSAPTVLAYGMADPVVPYAEALALDARLTALGVRHDLVPYPNSGHGLDQDPASTQRTNELFLEYAATYLK